MLRAIRSIIRVDSDPARQALFQNLMRARPSVRVAYRLHRVMPFEGASAFLVWSFGLVTLLRIAPPGRPVPRVLAVAGHANAKRQVARVAS